jgi:hypothetical protein
MPRELLLVLRNQSYIRYLDKELGSPVNRFVSCWDDEKNDGYQRLLS